MAHVSTSDRCVLRRLPVPGPLCPQRLWVAAALLTPVLLGAAVPRPLLGGV